ncbi:DUF551 domain-containing protein [Escherichia coli]
MIIDNSQYFNLEITHWMPLPSPPSANQTGFLVYRKYG